MNRFEVGLGEGGELDGVDLRNEGHDAEKNEDRPSRPVAPRDFPVRLPGYRELDTRIDRRREG